jgi:hypothetical protein
VSVDPELIAEMNQWRFTLSPVPTPEEAIVALLRIGLTAIKEESSVSSAAPDDARVRAFVKLFDEVGSSKNKR